MKAIHCSAFSTSISVSRRLPRGPVDTSRSERCPRQVVEGGGPASTLRPESIRQQDVCRRCFLACAWPCGRLHDQRSQRMKRSEVLGQRARKAWHRRCRRRSRHRCLSNCKKSRIVLLERFTDAFEMAESDVECRLVALNANEWMQASLQQPSGFAMSSLANRRHPVTLSPHACS